MILRDEIGKGNGISGVLSLGRRLDHALAGVALGRETSEGVRILFLYAKEKSG